MSTGDEPKSPFSQEALREIAREKVLWAVGVKIHALLFFTVNIFLALLNFFVTGGVCWYLYVLSGWFVGFGIHVTVYFMYVRGVIGENKKGLILHGIVDILASQLLFMINFLIGIINPWFFWPVGAMIAAFIVHVILYLKIIGPDNRNGEKKSWMERKIDEELRKAGK